MITVDKLVVKNFRLINEITIEPANNAITGIIGPNGSGKSSLLIALKWCLFGETPENVKQGDLRRQGSEYKDPCSVEATIIHDGQKVKVKREIRGRNNTATVNIWVDGTLQSKTSVGTAENWVKKRLGFGVEMFSTIFVIGQKELDNLIKDKPTARRALIERLTGIEKLSKALDNARSELSSSKKNLSMHDITEYTVDSIERTANNAQATLMQAEKEVGSLKASLVLKEKNRDKTKQNYDVALKKYEEKANQEKTISLLEEHQITLEVNAKQLSEMVKEQELNNEELKEEDLEILQKKLDEAVTELGVARSSLNIKSAILHNLTENIETNISLVKQYTDTLASSPDQDILAKKIKQLSDDVLKLSDEVSDYKGRLTSKHDLTVSLSTNLTTTKEILQSIELSELDLAKCPTCDTNIVNKSDFIKKISDKVSTEKLILDSVKEELAEIKKIMLDKESYLKETNATLEGIISQQSEHSNTKDMLISTQTKLDDEQKQCIKIKSDISELEESIKVLDNQVEGFKKTVYDFESSLKFQKSIESLKLNLKKATSDAKDNLIKVNNAKKMLIDIEAPSIAEGQALRKTYDEANDIFNKAVESENNYRANMESARIMLAESQVRLEAARTALQKKQAAVQYVSHITSAVDLITSYRKDYLAKLAPELASEATMLISQMTQGAYIEIILDENFTPSVMSADGAIKPVAWLSGGEESCVALALRMAIGDIVSQGAGGLLWLDEVLTAQDDGRRSALLTTLREYGRGRQVILINHSPEAIDSVDNIIEIKQTSNGSILKEKIQLEQFSEENFGTDSIPQSTPIE